MSLSLEVLERFNGPAKKFEITAVRDNERRLYTVGKAPKITLYWE